MQADIVSIAQLPPELPPVQPLGQVSQIWSYRRHFFSGYWLVLGIFVLVAVLAPVLAPYDPVRSDLPNQLLPPSWQHWFGTDIYGMDIYSRVLWATRTDFTIALIGVLLAVVVGVPLGALSGYLGGFADDALSRFSEMIQAIPLFLFALMVFAALGNSSRVLVGVVALVNAPIFLKLTRSVVLPLRGADFIAAARCAGLSPIQVVVRHILPNALAPVSSQFSISCAYAIQITAGLSFLGFGVPIPYPEWGSMIQEGASRIIYGEWWTSVFPGLAVLIAVLGFGGVGRQIHKMYAS
ncbi:MAG: ABC transporter permease [Candidatus Dormibacteraceae bacterium]